MRVVTLATPFFLASLSLGRVAVEKRSSTCVQIAQAISSASDVWYPGSLHYLKDVSHWATSSSDISACSVEPGTAEDVGKILQIVGSTRTPFAVKGGGHATNPGFSSTTGVHVAMYKFSEVTYHPDTQTVDVGSGLIWDDVYAALEPHGVNVVGGRVSGVGVAGFSLGGGYSWLTNERGLTVDNIVSYELVLPNGTVTTVDPNTPDLFFSLKGGYNNFGIVTRFTFKAYPQGQVWGGLVTYTGDQLDKVNAATAKFSAEVADPKAQIISTYNSILGLPGVSEILFYNGPTPPAGIFDDFLAIPSFTKDVSTRSFSSLVQVSPANATGNQRAVFHTVSLVDYSDNIIDAVKNETIFWGEHLSLASATFISYDVEPFLSSIFSKGSAALSAYPPSRARGLLPLNIYYAWTLPAFDDVIRNAAVQSAQHLTAVAQGEGQNIADAALYGNYAIADTPLERIFGANLPSMRVAKQKYDPQNVMGLAGGWKL